MKAKKRTPAKASKKVIKKAPVKQKAKQSIKKKAKPTKASFSLKTVTGQCERCDKILRVKKLKAYGEYFLCKPCDKILMADQPKKSKKKKSKKKNRGTNVPSAKSIAKKSDLQWFAVQIYGNDTSCRKKILENARRANLFPHLISRVVIPRVRQPKTRKDGKVVFRNCKAFPGYLLVKCKLTPEVQHCVEGTNGYYVSSYKERIVDKDTGEVTEGDTKITSKRFTVVRMLPFTERFTLEDMKKNDFNPPVPTPLKEKEVKAFTAKPKKVTPIRLGIHDYVEITQGPYKGTRGTVCQIHDERSENPEAVVVFLLMGEKVNARFPFSSLARSF